MTQQEVLDYNRLCAEFLGWEYIDKDSHPNAYENYGWWLKGTYSKDVDALNNPNWKGFNSGLKFHSDWNWIMEVIEAIVKSREIDRVLFLSICSKKETVVQAIDQFLIWYNENLIDDN